MSTKLDAAKVLYRQLEADRNLVSQG